MAQPGKKSRDLTILNELYDSNNGRENQPDKPVSDLLAKVREYFSRGNNVEKWLSGAILFFGFFGLIFSILRFNGLIQAPYLTTLVKTPLTVNLNLSAQEDVLGLSTRDTDQDGLSDFDEINIYQSSPYLKDSDSDGIDDQREVARGSNPVCPEGQDCFGFNDLRFDVSAQAPGPSLQLGETVLTGEASASQVRQLLRQAGMSEELLSQLTDEELIAAYQEVAGQTVESNTGVALDANQLNNLTPDQIRQLLREQGVSEANLEQISDEELMQLVQETISEIK